MMKWRNESALDLYNLVVAIFLILNGLIGLGLLRWLHL